MPKNEPNTYAPNRALEFLNDSAAAALIGVAKDTLKVWRSKSRRAGRLIGPRWLELGGEGRARIIRYRPADLQAWTDGAAVPLEPKKRRGRPRKDTSR